MATPPSALSNPPAARLGGLTLIWVAAVVWRLWIGTQYAGWEESDYGNLAMIEGVRAGGFLHYDMNHMPGYYALSALVHVAVENAMLAGRAVSLVGGVGAMAGSMWLALRLGGPRAAALTGLWLCVQPEFALYTSSTLREPLYALGLVGFVGGLFLRRPLLAGLWGCLAFSVRFDALLVLGAAAAVHVWGERRALVMYVRAMGPVLVGAFVWAVYCRFEHGTFAFWSHAVAVNLETGLGAESERSIDWLLAGTDVSVRLLGWLLPWRLGWGVWLGSLGVLLTVSWRRPSALRTLAATALMATGFWGLVGFVGQHSPEHNLYWKWLMPLVPLLVPVAAVGWIRALEAGGTRKAWVALALAVTVVQTAGSHLKETRRQVRLSQELYAPQLALAKWFETAVPEQQVVVVDNIPACWINRRPHGRTMVSWFDVPVPPGDEEALAAWLVAEKIPWVLWFKEDWTQAPRVAPRLAEGGVQDLGRVRLIERSREDSYGWILFEVRGEDIPIYAGPPPPTAH